MATSPRRSRDDWIRAATVALRDGGVDALRVEPLAVALGVTKGSFYWHFASRDALLEAVLDTWEEVGTGAIIVAVDAEAEDDPERSLRALWRRTHELSSEMRAELAIRDLAQRDEAVRDRVRRVDDRRMAYLRRQYRRLGLPAGLAEARAMLTYSLLFGNVLVEATHGRTSRARVLQRAIDDLLRPA